MVRLVRRAGRDEIIRRDAVLDDPVLSRLPVLKARTGANFLLHSQKAERLSALWADAGTASAPVKPTEADTLPFDASNLESTGETIARQIKARRGQQAFRDKLLAVYGRRCAIQRLPGAGCAGGRAHPHHRGAETIHTANGLILRADLHTLLDCGLLAVDTDGSRVVVASSIGGPSYGNLHGRALRPREAGRRGRAPRRCGWGSRSSGGGTGPNPAATV